MSGTPQALPQVLTRIYIREDGDLLVTDLWEEIETLLENIGGTQHEMGEDL